MMDTRGMQMAEAEHAARLAAVKAGYEREIERLTREFERECADGDSLLRLIGLDPDYYRTEGGSLNLPKIRARLEDQRTGEHQ